MNHAGGHSWEARPTGIHLFGGITRDEVRERAAAGGVAASAILTGLGERVLVKKVLTFEVYRVDRTKKPWTHGPVLATVKGWDAFDAFLAQHGTKLVRETTKDGISMIRMPEGWDSMVVAMENHFSDGTVETM